jgi:rubrerythrin
VKAKNRAKEVQKVYEDFLSGLEKRVADATLHICPEPKCATLMHKAGFIWSGREKVQRWRCPKCGRTTTKS